MEFNLLPFQGQQNILKFEQKYVIPNLSFHSKAQVQILINSNRESLFGVKDKRINIYCLPRNALFIIVQCQHQNIFDKQLLVNAFYHSVHYLLSKIHRRKQDSRKKYLDINILSQVLSFVICHTRAGHRCDVSEVFPVSEQRRSLSETGDSQQLFFIITVFYILFIDTNSDSFIMYDMEDFDQIQTAEFREAFNEFDKVILIF